MNTPPSREIVLRVMDMVYSTCIWVSGAALVAMTAIIPVGIINRYFFGTGAAWAEPVAILCMVTFTFVGAAASYRAGSHLAVSLVTDRLPPHLQKICALLVKLFLAIISLFLVWYGTALCMRLLHQPIAEFPVLSAGAAYSPLPVGSFITLLFVVESIVYGPQTKRPVVRLGTVGDEDATLTIE